jgi:hypothetical protein
VCWFVTVTDRCGVGCGRVTGVADVTHYRGSEETGLLPAPLGVFGGGGVFLVFTDFRRAGWVRVWGGWVCVV